MENENVEMVDQEALVAEAEHQAYIDMLMASPSVVDSINTAMESLKAVPESIVVLAETIEAQSVQIGQILSRMVGLERDLLKIRLNRG